MLITRPFARILERLGVILRQVGEATEYRGTRIPYMVNLRESEGAMAHKCSRVAGLLGRRELAYRSMRESPAFVPFGHELVAHRDGDPTTPPGHAPENQNVVPMRRESRRCLVASAGAHGVVPAAGAEIAESNAVSTLA